MTRLALIALAVACGILAVLPAMPSSAQTSAQSLAQSPPVYAPVATPTLDPDALKVPDSKPATGAKTLDLNKNDKGLPPPLLPNKVELGKYDLEFKAGHSSDVNPRTGYDSGETSRLPKGKTESVLPDYFGLKLSTPTK